MRERTHKMETRRISAIILCAVVFMFALSSSAQFRKKKAQGDAKPTMQNYVSEIQVLAGKEINIKATKKMDMGIVVVPDPIRMMIDIKGLGPSPDLPRSITIGQGMIKSIRVREFTGGPEVVTRLEIMLTQDAQYRIDRKAKEVTVTLEPKARKKDDTIPPELFYKAQKVTTELIKTGDVRLEIQPHVTVPKSASQAGAIFVTSGVEGGAPRPEVEAMKPDASYTLTATRIKDVKYRGADSQIQILVRTDGMVGEFKEFTMGRPNRLVIDLIGVKGKVPRNSYTVNQGGVKRIRLGEHSNYTRIVVDFSTKKIPQYYITRTKGGIMIAVAMEAG